MGVVTVAYLVYIFLHNWNLRKSLEEEEVSWMFHWKCGGFA